MQKRRPKDRVELVVRQDLRFEYQSYDCQRKACEGASFGDNKTRAGDLRLVSLYDLEYVRGETHAEDAYED